MVDAHVGAWWQSTLRTASDAPPRHDELIYTPPTIKTEPQNTYYMKDSGAIWLSTRKKGVANSYSHSTRSRGRTGTGITAHRILSPACLPIPPSEPLSLL